jgi:hypothetical protein
LAFLFGNEVKDGEIKNLTNDQINAKVFFSALQKSNSLNEPEKQTKNSSSSGGDYGINPQFVCLSLLDVLTQLKDDKKPTVF